MDFQTSVFDYIVQHACSPSLLAMTLQLALKLHNLHMYEQVWYQARSAMLGDITPTRPILANRVQALHTPLFSHLPNSGPPAIQMSLEAISRSHVQFGNRMHKLVHK